MSSGKVLLGVLAGVAAGALIGVLFAPDKGSETRRKIARKGEDYAQGLKEKLNEIIDDLTQKVETAQGPENPRKNASTGNAGTKGASAV